MIRLRIVRPLPAALEGFDLSHLRFGASYDIHHPLCDVLLVAGYGVPVDDSPARAPLAIADDRPPRALTMAAQKPRKPKPAGRRRTGPTKR
jgi:hypothetical protein